MFSKTEINQFKNDISCIKGRKIQKHINDFQQAIISDKCPHISRYGNMNSAEDFAETISYATKPENDPVRIAFKEYNPNRYKFAIRLLQEYGGEITE